METPAEWVCGGYYLAYPSRPGALLSVSPCLSDFFPDSWAIAWSSERADERARAAAVFGAGGAALAWATSAFGSAFGWPNTFYTLEAAHDARACHVAPNAQVRLFGLGLHPDSAGRFLDAAAPREPNTGSGGVFECVSRGGMIAPGGEAAGFELLATHSGLLTCSWLCNGLEQDCALELGVRTNALGLIDDYGDALRCTAFVSRPETGAEPGLWLPWLLTIYR